MGPFGKTDASSPYGRRQRTATVDPSRIHTAPTPVTRHIEAYKTDDAPELVATVVRALVVAARTDTDVRLVPADLAAVGGHIGYTGSSTAGDGAS